MKSTAWNISALANASVTPTSASPSAIAVASINQSIQGIAQRYCVDCKIAFEEMSKVTQSVTATRKELALYDMKQRETLSQALFASPMASPSMSGYFPSLSGDPSSLSGNPPSLSRLPSLTSNVDDAYGKKEAMNRMVFASRCYGCTLYTIKHCLTVLRALVTLKQTHPLMLKEVIYTNLLAPNIY